MNEKQIHFQQYNDSGKEGALLNTSEDLEKKKFMSDAKIWKAFKNGDEESLTYIYTIYANKMYNYGCQFTSHKELVRDCIQELFIEIIDKRQKLGDTVSIKFYLFKALRRKLLRVLKKEEKFIYPDEVIGQKGFNILEDASVKFINQEFSDHQKEIISNECNKLPPKQKEALLLYFYEGMSYREIAETIGMTRTKSARALIYRAIDSLSTHLQRYRNILYPLFPFLLSTQFI